MTLAIFQQIGFMEYLIIGVVLLLLFGRRLPEVGRGLGKGIVEFKRGLKDVGDDVPGRGDSHSSAQAHPPLNKGGEQSHASSRTDPEQVAPSEG